MNALSETRLQAALNEMEEIDEICWRAARDFEEMIKRETAGIPLPAQYRADFPLPDFGLWFHNDPQAWNGTADFDNDRCISFTGGYDNDDRFRLPKTFLHDPDGYTRAFHDACQKLRASQQRDEDRAARDRARDAEQRDREQLAQLLAKYGTPEPRS